MHVVWINEAACRKGSVERYVSDTAARLRARGVRSTLLYSVTSRVDRDIAASFEGVYPQVQLAEQLRALAPDVIYVHQVAEESAVSALAAAGAPVLRFFHDPQLSRRRGSRITALGRHLWGRPSGFDGDADPGFVQRARACASRIKLASASLFTREGTREGTREVMLDAQQPVAAYVVGSTYMRERVAVQGLDRARIHVLPLYAQAFAAPAKIRRERDLVLFVGRLLPGKGVDVLLRAIAVTRSRARLLIAGDGPEEGALQALAASLRLGARVEFAGRVAPAELPRLHARARCLALPSRVPEAFGLAGVEALSSGLPVIASGVGGVLEWLEDGRNGLAVPSGDLVKLGRAIDRLVLDDTLARAMGQRASASHRERFLPEYHLDGLCALLQSVAATEAS